jgi:Hg(II)-responsive transcriptional regulator
MKGDMQAGSFKIGHVAKASGTGIETIRFYERSGLIDEPPRRESGYREYPGETIARLRFIKRAKALGFSLKEISDLLALSKSGKGSCGNVRKRAQEKQRQIEKMIADLKSIQIALGEFVSTCEKRNPSDACPFLKRFHEED